MTDPKEKDRRTAEKGMSRIYINAGKVDGFYAGNLIDMLNHLVTGKRVDVGRIDLMPGYSLFDVADGDARRVVEGLTGSDFLGKRIYCEIADHDKDYARASTRRKGKKSATDNGVEEDMESVHDFFLRRARANASGRKTTTRQRKNKG